MNVVLESARHRPPSRTSLQSWCAQTGTRTYLKKKKKKNMAFCVARPVVNTTTEAQRAFTDRRLAGRNAEGSKQKDTARGGFSHVANRSTSKKSIYINTNFYIL